MRNVALAAFALLLVTSGPAAAAGACTVTSGDRVVLYSSSDDPDVLVWASQQQLRDYYAASFERATQLGMHAVLVKRGARAVVRRCMPNDVYQRLSNAPGDAVDIVIVAGPNRGLRGWVIQSDLRRM